MDAREGRRDDEEMGDGTREGREAGRETTTDGRTDGRTEEERGVERVRRCARKRCESSVFACVSLVRVLSVGTR